MITFPLGNQLQIQKRDYKDQKWVWDTFQGGNEPIHVLGSIDFTHSILKKMNEMPISEKYLVINSTLAKLKLNF